MSVHESDNFGKMLGARIREIRMSNGLNQAKFAKELGFSRSFLSEVESGKKVPGAEFLLSLKRLSGESIDYLLSGEGDQPVSNRDSSADEIANRDSATVGMRPFDATVMQQSGKVPLFLVPAPAGSATPGDDHVEQMVEATELCVPRAQNIFACRIAGDSMVGAGIENGDLVVVERREDAQSSDIVVCTVDAELTIKRLEVVGERTYLYPANERYRPIEIVEGMSVVVWGIVRRVIHSFE